MKKTSVLSVIALATICCATGHAQSENIVTEMYPAEQAAVARAVSVALEAAKAKNFDELDSGHLFGPKFTKFDDWEPLERQDAEIARKAEHDGFSAIDVFMYEVQELKVDVFGMAAIATFVLDYNMKVGKDEASARARSTMVFVNDSGQWKIVHEHFSPFKSNP